jgi:hypothetical protein
LNTDFGQMQDITVVPPGAAFYIRTNHIWGDNPIPPLAPGDLSNNFRGSSMSVTVKASKEGKKDLFVVHVRPRTRERIAVPPPGSGFAEGKETSSNSGTCFKVHQSEEQREDPGDDSVE